MNTQCVMVGTLYCGEGDFDRNRESVQGQTWPCEQVVIANLPEVEAHHQLYLTFVNSTYDYLLKLDADMVLKSAGVVAELVSLMQRTNKKHIVHLVDDFFTHTAIEGIHFYRRDVQWNWDQFTAGRLDPDRLDNISRRRFHSESLKRREAIAWHCYHATDKQAFHFGYHRWIKGRSFTSSRKCCSLVFEHYLTNPNSSPLRLACIGILAASSNGHPEHHSYGPGFDQTYEHWKTVPVSIEDLRGLLA